nr:hypothetical protein CFP56_04244 [Quercus suber]
MFYDYADGKKRGRPLLYEEPTCGCAGRVELPFLPYIVDLDVSCESRLHEPKHLCSAAHTANLPRFCPLHVLGGLGRYAG